MALPFFYITDIAPNQTELELDEDTSKHVVQVLRMTKGERLNLTDGKGNRWETSIEDDHRKRCKVKIITHQFQPWQGRKVSIGISLLKNAARFEWFLEKATEIGVKEIIPLLCTRTEKEKFREDRLQQVLVSAMLQSQQCWLPVLHAPIAYELLFRQEEIASIEEKYIAHCLPEKQSLISALKPNAHSRIILIGPEGDFTEQEINMALAHQFVAVALGENRLRTETAGMVAAGLLCLI
jgi:16S rRNA (uracil1498-N3)-methyltransferase